MTTPESGSGRRRNLYLAIVLGLIAVGFYVAFFFAVSNRPH